MFGIFDETSQLALAHNLPIMAVKKGALRHVWILISILFSATFVLFLFLVVQNILKKDRKGNPAHPDDIILPKLPKDQALRPEKRLHNSLKESQFREEQRLQDILQQYQFGEQERLHDSLQHHQFREVNNESLRQSQLREGQRNLPTPDTKLVQKQDSGTQYQAEKVLQPRNSSTQNQAGRRDSGSQTGSRFQYSQAKQTASVNPSLPPSPAAPQKINISQPQYKLSYRPFESPIEPRETPIRNGPDNTSRPSSPIHFSKSSSSSTTAQTHAAVESDSDFDGDNIIDDDDDDDSTEYIGLASLKL